MNSQNQPDPTVSFYDAHAAEFSRATETLDMRSLYAQFLPLVPAGGNILDAGCGAGRDSAFFKAQGFRVTAFDASRELADIASRNLGEPVRVMDFLDLEFADEFDGVWACASLLHLPSGPLGEGVHRLALSLKQDGVFYASFKYGESEGIRDGRFFNDFTEAKLTTLLAGEPMLQLRNIWRTPDVRVGRAHEIWLNVTLLRTGSACGFARRVT